MWDILTSGHRAYGLYENVNDYSHTEGESLGTHNRWVRHWPLCRPSDTIIQAPLVGIVPAVGIGEK